MLIDFSIKNSGPIGNEVTLSFEPGDYNLHNENFLINTGIENLKLLKIGVIYGPNASGKSTILHSLTSLYHLVTDPIEVKTKKISIYQPNKGSEVNSTSATQYTIRLISNNTVYKYCLAYNKNCITSEELSIGLDKDQIVYTRTTDQNNQTSKIEFGATFKDKYVTVLPSLQDATLWNNTVLGGSLKINSNIKEITDVINWFNDYCYEVIDPGKDLFSYVSSLIESGKAKKQNILKILKRADLAINDIIIKSEKFDDLPENIQLSVAKEHPDKSLDEIRKNVTLKHVLFQHNINGNLVAFDYGEESLGTQRFYQICGILDILLRSSCLVSIDEVENSLHPDLLEFFLYAFICNSTKSQLLITTHYRELLLNKDIIRPDSIWFTSKEESGMTNLYSMGDFDHGMFEGVANPYYNLYKNGRFGAKPSLGDYYINLEEDDQEAQ